jgi:hypothetical protein
MRDLILPLLLSILILTGSIFCGTKLIPLLNENSQIAQETK